MTNMHPRRERIAFQIYQIAEPLGWDITVTELADRLKLSRAEVGYVCNRKGWMPRLRKTMTDRRAFGKLGTTWLSGGFATATLLPDNFDRED